MVDPGPLDEGHLAAVAATAPVDVRPDHPRPPRPRRGRGPAARAAAPARPWHRRRPTTARRWRTGGLELRGARHARAHRRLGLLRRRGVGDERVVFTGDTILGRGTTVVAYRTATSATTWTACACWSCSAPCRSLPGHGPALADCAAAAAFYLRHRLARLDQVRAAVGRRRDRAGRGGGRGLRRRRPVAVAGGRTVGAGAAGLSGRVPETGRESTDRGRCELDPP